MEKRSLKPYHGLILFAAVIIALIFIATPLQQSFGLTGVALTELMLLALTAAAFIICKPDFTTTYPLRLPRSANSSAARFYTAGRICSWFRRCSLCGTFSRR